MHTPKVKFRVKEVCYAASTPSKPADMNFIMCIKYNIEETRTLFKKFEYKYNCERYHQSLNYLTPMGYYHSIKIMLLSTICVEQEQLLEFQCNCVIMAK